MSTPPKDIDLFDIGRLGDAFDLDSFGVDENPNTPYLMYWLNPKKGVTVTILFDSKATLKLALASARVMARGFNVVINYGSERHVYNAAYFETHFCDFLDYRGATPGSGRQGHV